MAARPVVAAVVLLLIASGIGAGAPPGPAPQPDTGTQIAYDSTLLRIDVAESGDATWTIEYRVQFDGNNNTEQAFEELQEDIRANRSSFEDQFRTRMERTARSAENATGREMTIENLSVTTETEITAGVVRYTFDWTNFAAVSGDEIRIGDAIAGIVLDSDTTLTISWPERYGVTDIRPGDADERRDGIAIWYGEKTFAPDEPRLVLATNSATPTVTATATPTDQSGPVSPTATPTDDDTDEQAGIDPILVGILGVLLLAVVILVVYLWREDRFPGGGPTDVGAGPGDGGGPSETGAEPEVRDGTSVASASGVDAESEDEQVPPQELLSNEERVLQLLEENGGRMKQQQVVSQLGWTDAKTSQVVSSLREEEDIEAFRIGRENVLALPGETDF